MLEASSHWKLECLTDRTVNRAPLPMADCYEFLSEWRKDHSSFSLSLKDAEGHLVEH